MYFSNFIKIVKLKLFRFITLRQICFKYLFNCSLMIQITLALTLAK